MTKYIFLDDEKNSKTKGFVEFFNSAKQGIRTIDVQPLKEWRLQIESIKDLFAKGKVNKSKNQEVLAQLKEIRERLQLSEEESPDGIILDLRLDENVHSTVSKILN